MKICGCLYSYEKLFIEYGRGDTIYYRLLPDAMMESVMRNEKVRFPPPLINLQTSYLDF